ncbi:IS21-like element helper ATPase IstB [Methanothrix sp.]|uniref:IS21-like element helper ATPase IstB n=1 Tax=Methanothrix sp. TaxID=90426 RepID=UPI0032AE9D20
MSEFLYERLHHNLRLLKLTTLESILDNHLEIAIKEGRSFIEILDYLVDQEIQSKEARSQALRMRIACFPFEKHIDDFDFKYQPSIDKAVIKDIASLRFVRNAENVVFLGPPGVGKTHLAIGLGIEAIKAGFKVYFANASSLVEKLEMADNENKLDEKLRNLSKFHLLIIDEMGYLPFNDYGAHCFFQLVSRRYEKAATIFTSNKSFGEWGHIFKDHVIASAILDRILHHCVTVNIKGDSYRLKERRRQGVVQIASPGVIQPEPQNGKVLSRPGEISLP